MSEEQFQLYLNEIIASKNQSVSEMNVVQDGIIKILISKILELKNELEYKGSEEIDRVIDACDKKISEIGSVVGGVTTADILDVLTSTSKVKMLSANQGRILKEMIDTLSSNGVTIVDNLTSSSTTSVLSANQGRVLKSLIEAITIPQIVNELISGGVTKTLSAEQGKTLKGITDTINTAITNILNGAIKVGKATTAEQAEQLTDQRTGTKKIWTGTEAQYTALSTKDADTLYFCS